MELLYKKYKRRKIGYCNICRTKQRLTWDHIPPQGGIQLQPVEINRIAGSLVPTLKSEKPEISRDGLKYRTICSRCNANLGSRFDPALNNFAISVGRFLNSSLVFPPIVDVEAQPNLVSKAVLGHLLSARLSDHDSFYDSMIRDILLDSSKTIPDKINIHYWIHPYSLQVVFRDGLLLFKKSGVRETYRIGLLKYFPLGYVVSDSKSFEGLDSLTSWRNENENILVKLPIKLTEIKPSLWPEAPTPTSFLFIGEEGLESLKTHPKQNIILNAGAQQSG